MSGAVSFRENLRTLLPRLDALRSVATSRADGSSTGRHGDRQRRGFSHEFISHRDYVPGDDPRLLDWRALGRSDRLHLKQFRDETARLGVIVLDVSASMNFRSEISAFSKFDVARLVASAWARLLDQSRERTTLWTFDGRLEQRLPVGSGPAHWNALVDLLETLEPGAENATHPPGTPPGKSSPDPFHVLRDGNRSGRHASVALIGDLMFDTPENVLRTLAALRTPENSATSVQVLDGAELDFPYENMTAFADLESPARSIPVDAARLRKAYLAEMGRFLDNIDSLCRQQGIASLRLRTDADVADPLVHFLRTLF